MSRRAWLLRLGVAAVITALAWIVTTLMDFEPDLPRMALVVVTGTALFAVAYDALRDTPTSWRARPRFITRPIGQDAVTSTTTRVLEGHLTAAEPSAALRDRLAALAQTRLQLRHALTLDDPRAAQLVGDRTMAVLRGPVRRLSRAEITATVERIEEL